MLYGAGAAPILTARAGRTLMLAHFNRGIPFGDQVLRQLGRDIVGFPGMVVMERHPVDGTSRWSSDPNFHTYRISKPSAMYHTLVAPHHGPPKPRSVHIGVTYQSDLDMTMKEQGRLARSGSENGSVPLST